MQQAEDMVAASKKTGKTGADLPNRYNAGSSRRDVLTTVCSVKSALPNAMHKLQF